MGIDASDFPPFDTPFSQAAAFGVNHLVGAMVLTPYVRQRLADAFSGATKMLTASPQNSAQAERAMTVTHLAGVTVMADGARG